MREADPMATRGWPGPGPVFAYEWLTASRRWQGYALRSLLVLLLLLGLVGLAAPAAAGAICSDKARGNLTLLFATDLTDAEIVLGKLAARLAPALGLIACAAPVLALATLFGGVDPAVLTGAILVCLACAVFGCTLALTLSVWGRKAHFARLVRLLPSPSLDGNPVLWREWHRRRPSRWSVAGWGTFGVLSCGFSLWAIVDALDGAWPVGRKFGPVISGLQVSAGLLLLSVSAATSLAEERQRGSLDVLLVTPLSTRSIVLGKFWGAFRCVPPLTVMPVLVGAALATHTGFALGPVLIGVLVIAYGAAITSRGLALATWLPRMGRVIGLTDGLYVVVLIAAIPVGMIFVGQGPSETCAGFASASLFWGVGYSSATFGGNSGAGQDIGGQAAWLVLWIVA
jgi:ABC-type transport system involved in multi-copper enzyme maturation permease subunit